MCGGLCLLQSLPTVLIGDGAALCLRKLRPRFGWDECRAWGALRAFL